MLYNFENKPLLKICPILHANNFNLKKDCMKYTELFFNYNVTRFNFILGLLMADELYLTYLLNI